MKFWNLLKLFPKFALVAAVLILSTGLFAVWWSNRSPKQAPSGAEVSAKADTSRQEAEIEREFGKLVLADNDLYNIETGECLFKNWLKGGMPLALFFDPGTKKLIARYEKGFVRYNPDGSEDASILQAAPIAVMPDGKTILFVKGGDIWRANIDRRAFKLTDEKQVTSIGEFMDRDFAESILMETEKTLLVRNKNQLLRVNLDTGETHWAKFPPVNLKQRSPDGKYLVGDQGGKFFCYDLDTDNAQTIELGKRVGMTDYLWLDDKRCACIENGAVVKLYDRESNALNAVAELPVKCRHIVLPSPDGRFAFCANDGGKGVLVDFQKRTANPVQGGSGMAWVDGKTFMFSRDVQDSGLRGTWMQAPGEPERRVSPQPYFVYRKGSSLLPLGKIVVFIGKNNLMKIAADGTGLKEAGNMAATPSRLIGIAEMKTY